MTGQSENCQVDIINSKRIPNNKCPSQRQKPNEAAQICKIGKFQARNVFKGAGVKCLGCRKGEMKGYNSEYRNPNNRYILQNTINNHYE